MTRQRTGRPHPEDRGLAAVERVRGVRETDSRIGLQQVLAERATAVAGLARLEAQLSAVPVPVASSPAELVASRTALLHVGTRIREARADVATAEVVAEEARARWAADKARLAAVEHLLDKRSGGRRTEAARRAAREADDLAAQAWARRERGGH